MTERRAGCSSGRAGAGEVSGCGTPISIRPPAPAALRTYRGRCRSSHPTPALVRVVEQARTPPQTPVSGSCSSTRSAASLVAGQGGGDGADLLVPGGQQERRRPPVGLHPDQVEALSGWASSRRRAAARCRRSGSSGRSAAPARRVPPGRGPGPAAPRAACPGPGGTRSRRRPRPRPTRVSPSAGHGRPAPRRPSAGRRLRGGTRSAARWSRPRPRPARRRQARRGRAAGRPSPPP